MISRWFLCQSCAQWQKQNTALLARIADLEAQRREEQKAATSEREKLVDKIMAIQNPAAVMALRADAPVRKEPPRVVRTNYPGYNMELPAPTPAKSDPPGMKVLL